MPWDRSKYPNLKRLEKPDLDLRPEDLECYLNTYDDGFWHRREYWNPYLSAMNGASAAIKRLCQEVKRLRGW